MTLLNKEQILSSRLPTEVVAVPEWGGEVAVRVLTGCERDAFEASMFTGGAKRANLENVRARLVALCVVDEEGRRLFTDTEADALGATSAPALDRLFTVAQRLNGMTPDAVETARGN